METTALLIAVFFIGAVLGGLGIYILLRPTESKLRDALSAQARAEQEANRVPGLEGQLASLREENTKFTRQVVELETQHEADGEKIQWAEKAKEYLREAFQSLASQTLQSNADEFLKRAREQLDTLLTAVRGDWTAHKSELDSLVTPLKNELDELDKQVRELEQKREGAYSGLQVQLKEMAQSNKDLRDTTTNLQSTTLNLVQALKSPTVRGRWGEYQLRRVVEMAGMTPHVDFEEQTGTDEGRPDMFVYLPNQGTLPVDAKTPMQAYLDAIEATDDDTRKAKLNDHAKAMRGRVRELGQRRYQQQFKRAPDFVIMFVPNDACLSAAFERDPELLEFAYQQGVVPTTPVTLLALLKAVAYGWQQHQVTENALQIAEQGKELYERLTKFIEHLRKTGKALDSAVEAYNAAVGSLDGRLLPAARRFKDLGAIAGELPDVAPIERQARLPAAPGGETD